MVRTTLSKVDKADTSSAEAPMTRALVAQPGSKASNDNLTDDDPDLLHFDVVESGITFWTSSLLQMCWPDSGKPNYMVWHFEWSGFHAP
jgi:hypothetical protein